MVQDVQTVVAGMKVLDLFSGSGGAAMGLHRAWPDADITGVDLKAMPRYPFRFIQADAMTFQLEGYDFIWASPPCQEYSVAKNMHIDRSYPDLVAPTRTRLEASGVPYIIENVVGAPLNTVVELCGTMFGLKTFRHRRFETSYMVLAPKHKHEKHWVAQPNGGYSAHYKGSTHITVAGNNWNFEDGKAAMGIEWMNHDELKQAIPPAYSEFLARQWRPND